MARDTLNESERRCLDSMKTVIEASREIGETKQQVRGQRVRFVDDESVTERFVSTDRVDAAPRARKVHILKHRSSSETSVLLRTPSLNGHSRSASVDSRLHARDSDNNNTLRENLNGKHGILKSTALERERLSEKMGSECNGSTRDGDCSGFKRNCNIYSVDQAKLIHSERKKSLPLASIPRLIGHRASESGAKAAAAEAVNDDSVGHNKDFTARAIGKISRGIGKLLRRSNSIRISEPDPIHKVAYLGNVLTGWAKGENCVEKPLATLWRNYNQSTKPDVVMKLSIANSGLKGATKDHGLTEYWSHRITYCASPPHYPKIFCWVYRHEGRKLKHELRCHAVLCSKESIAKKITEDLQMKLKQALAEFKKDKICRQNARLSLANSVYDNPTMPRRKILLSIGATNYRPPLERSKSAPKLGAIEEMYSEEEEEAETANEGVDQCGNPAKSVISSGSRRWRTDKIKSPRKHSLPEESSREIYRCVDVEHNVEDCSFSDEVFDLISKNFKAQNLECNGENETSRSSSRTDHPKMPRCILGCIDEASEMKDCASPCPVRDCKVLEMLGQTNFVTDSDDGSVSSGCETASTATSSDTEPSSLPHVQEDFVLAKLEGSAASPFAKCGHTCQRRLTSSISDFRTESEAENEHCSGSASETDIDLSTDENSRRRPSEEVNVVPIGEKNSFKRRSTYPPLKNLQEMLNDYTVQFDNMIDNMTEYDQLLQSNVENEVFRNTEDNVSACSDESGYSESEPGKESSVASTIMV